MFNGRPIYNSRISIQSEDLSDLVEIIAPYETPFLDILGQSIAWLGIDDDNIIMLKESVKVGKEDIVSSQLGIDDELDYQKQECLRTMLRQLENEVINGTDKIKGIIDYIKTNTFECKELDKEFLENAIKQGFSDVILTSGIQKRKLNTLCVNNVFNSEYGSHKVVASRWVPADTIILLNKARTKVLPKKGCSFQYEEINRSNDLIEGTITGEYRLALAEENCHGIIRGLNS